MIGSTPRRIGEILLDAGQLDTAQLESALQRQQDTGERVCSCCLGLALLPEGVLVEHLGVQKGVPGVELGRSAIPLSALALVPREVARQQRMLPLSLEGTHLLLAMADPDDVRTISEVEFVTGKRVVPHVALAGRLDVAIAASYEAVEGGQTTGHWLGPDVNENTDPGANALLIVHGSGATDDGLGGLIGADGDLEGAWLGQGTESQTGSGSTGELDQIPDPAGGSTGERRASPDKRVLVVDDDPDILAMVVRYLEGRGYRALKAERGREALKQIRGGRPDLIILDAMLPEVHGFEICQKVKKSKRFGATPVIMISAVYKGWRYREDVLRTYGADDYLEKPFSLERLAGKVEGLLENNHEGAAEEELLRESRAALEEGLEAQRQGNLDSAISRFREGIEVDPLSARLHFHLANLLAAREELYDAIHALEMTIELEPEFFPALKGLAILYQKKGFKRKSVEMWERALYAAPDVETRQKIRSHLFHML